ncbi:MAG: hypothetical protein JJT82_07375 [Legionellaceae bacterium]|nr:hypothetical protein [Legionellaceae bacterium]
MTMECTRMSPYSCILPDQNPLPFADLQLRQYHLHLSQVLVKGMSPMDRGVKIANPARYYPEVDMLEQDPDLDAQQKLQAMRNWRDDIILKLTASEENMDGKPADLEKLAQLNQRIAFYEPSPS